MVFIIRASLRIAISRKISCHFVNQLEVKIVANRGLLSRIFPRSPATCFEIWLAHFIFCGSLIVQSNYTDLDRTLWTLLQNHPLWIQLKHLRVRQPRNGNSSSLAFAGLSHCCLTVIFEIPFRCFSDEKSNCILCSRSGKYSITCWW